MSDIRKTIRFPDDLASQIQRQADRDGRSFSNVVIRLCRSQESSEVVPEDQAERSARIEATLRMPEPPNPMAWRCPAPRCTKVFGSPAAVCPMHGRRAVAV